MTNKHKNDELCVVESNFVSCPLCFQKREIPKSFEKEFIAVCNGTAIQFHHGDDSDAWKRYLQKHTLHDR